MKLKILLLTILLSSPSAFAFYTVQETGDLLKEKQMQASGELQFVTTGDTGINFIGRFDKGFDEDSNFRFVVGTGTTDFEAGAFYKWVPFPDYKDQPAIGFTFGGHFARYEKNNELSARAIPFVSKKFDTDYGLFTPYGALPLALSNYDSDTKVPLQLVLGTRFRHPDFKQCDFNAELGLELHDSFAYISLGAIFPAFE